MARRASLTCWVFRLVGDDHGVGVELQGLLHQEVGIAAGAEHLDSKEVAVTTDDVQRLRAYGPCGT